MSAASVRASNGAVVHPSGNPFVVTFPGTPHVGDPIGIWFSTDNSGQTLTTPPGWTLGYSTTMTNGSRHFIHKVYATSDGTSVSVTLSSGWDLVYIVAVFDGAMHGDFGTIGQLWSRGSSVAITLALSTGTTAQPNLVVFHEKSATRTAPPTVAPATTQIQNIYDMAASGASVYLGSYDTAGGTNDRTATYGAASTNSTGYQIPLTAPVAIPPSVYPQSGSVTQSGATVLYATTNVTTARIAYATDVALTSPAYTGTLTADADGIVTAALSGLTPDTVYYYGIEVAGTILTTGHGKFRTFPVAGSQASGSFLFGSCQFTNSNHAVFTAMAAHTTPHNNYGFFHQGDLHYRDWFTNGISDAPTIKAQQLSSTQQSNFAALLAAMPWAYTWDNHDYGGVGSDATNPANPVLKSMYRQMTPHYPLPTDTSDNTGSVDQTWTFGRVSFFMMDTRSQRSPSGATDNSSKSMLGAGQKARFKTWMADTAYPVKIILSGIPYKDYGGTAGDRWGAYLTEFAELATFFAASGYGSLFTITGDIHRNAADDGTNESYGHVPNAVSSPFDQSGGQPGAGWSQGYWPTDAGAVVSHNFMELDITDNGTSITVKSTGYDDSNVANVTLTKTFAIPTPPAVIAGLSGPVMHTTTMTLTVPKPAGVVDGDLLLLFTTSQSSNMTAEVTVPAGWTRAAPSFQAQNATFRVSAMFYKPIPSAAAETATGYAVTWPAAASGSRQTAFAARVPGASLANPIVAVASAFTSLGTNSAVAPTPASSAKGLLLMFGRGDIGAGVGAGLTNFGTGFTTENYFASQGSSTIDTADTTVSKTIVGLWSKQVPVGYVSENAAWNTVGNNWGRSAYGVVIRQYVAMTAPGSGGITGGFNFAGSFAGVTPGPVLAKVAGVGPIAVNSTTTLTVAKPANVADGDLLLLCITSQGSTAPSEATVPSGWIRVGPAFVPASTAYRIHTMFYKPIPSAAAETATSYLVTYPIEVSGSRQTGFIARITGADLTHVLGAVPTGYAVLTNSGTGFVATPTSATDGLLLVFGRGDIASGTDGSLINFGTGFTTETYYASKAPGGLTTPDDLTAGRSINGLWSKQVTPAYTSENASWVSVSDGWNRAGYAIVIRKIGSPIPPSQFSGRFNFAGSFSGSRASVGALASRAPKTVAQWIALAPAMYCAHRGGSADWPEETLYAYQQAAAWNPDLALEISVWQSSDGVWVCSHDQTTGRVFGTNYDIPTTPWSTLSLLRTTTSGLPIAKLTDVLDRYAHTRPIMVDNKGSQNNATFLNLIDTYGGPSWFIIKSYYNSAAIAAAAHAKGYTTWGYYYDADTPNLSSTQANWDLLGMDYNATAGSWTAIKSYGKPVLAHIVPNAAAATTAYTLGANGIMASGVMEVVLAVAPPIPMFGWVGAFAGVTPPPPPDQGDGGDDGDAGDNGIPTVTVLADGFVPFTADLVIVDADFPEDLEAQYELYDQLQNVDAAIGARENDATQPPPGYTGNSEFFCDPLTSDYDGVIIVQASDMPDGKGTVAREDARGYVSRTVIRGGQAVNPHDGFVIFDTEAPFNTPVTYICKFKPTKRVKIINYVTNPSVEMNTTGWHAGPNRTFTRVRDGSAPAKTYAGQVSNNTAPPHDLTQWDGRMLARTNVQLDSWVSGRAYRIYGHAKVVPNSRTSWSEVRSNPSTTSPTMPVPPSFSWAQVKSSSPSWNDVVKDKTPNPIKPTFYVSLVQVDDPNTSYAPIISPVLVTLPSGPLYANSWVPFRAYITLPDPIPGAPDPDIDIVFYHGSTIDEYNATWSLDAIIMDDVTNIRRMEYFDGSTKVPAYPKGIGYQRSDQYNDLYTWDSGDAMIKWEGTPHNSRSIFTGASTVASYTQQCRMDIHEDSVNGMSLCEPVYLSDPIIPAYSMWAGLLSIAPLERAARRELIPVYGRHAPIALSEKRSTVNTTLTLMTNTLSERESMIKIVNSGRIMMMRNPDDRYPETNWYMSIGDVSEERILPDHRDPRRRWKLDVQLVDRPSGHISSIDGQTWGQADARYHTWGTLKSGNRYWMTLLIGHTVAVATADMAHTLVTDADPGLYPTAKAARWSAV